MISSSSSVFVAYGSVNVEAQDKSVGQKTFCHLALYTVRGFGKGKLSTTTLFALARTLAGVLKTGRGVNFTPSYVFVVCKTSV